MDRELMVGDRVWWARCGIQEVTETCPVCFGKLRVTLVLGDGTELSLSCDYCGKGYEGPQGIVKRHKYVADAEMAIITKVATEETADGAKREYRSGCWCLTPDDLFDTREDAVARCQAKADDLAEEQRTRAEHIKKGVNKSYSWNAGYHMREVKDLQKRIEYHAERAKICKDRTKEIVKGA